MTETDLRWQLRQLPREIEPSRDLWPGISAAIERRPAPRAHRWMFPSLAMAASVLVVAGLAWKHLGSSVPAVPVEAAADTSALVVATESRAITDEYQAALRQYKGAPVPAALEPTLGELDRSVVQIQRAIARDPDSVFLLEQLRRTYSTRLALTQRAVTG
jgi:hypothetical protein